MVGRADAALLTHRAGR